MPPPPSDPAYGQVMAIMKHRAETDLAFRLLMRDLEKRMPAFVLTRMQGGSGFPVAQTLRHFFQEYLNRLRALSETVQFRRILS
jgi:hypothetical protein